MTILRMNPRCDRNAYRIEALGPHGAVVGTRVLGCPPDDN
jgi:hypothetical protein